MEIIDGYLWVTYSDAPDNPVNVGRVEMEQQGTDGLAYYPLPDGSYGVMAGTTIYLKEIQIPATYKGKPVTHILPYAFSSAANLVSISIPDSVTIIDDYAFNNCSNLTSVSIPDSVTIIGNFAFCNCYRLTSVTIPNSVTTIGISAFESCSSLTSIILPSTITVIEYSTFWYCSNLTSVTIPVSVTKLYNSIFGLTNLTEIHYGGTIEEWYAIEKSSSWDDYTGNYTIYCTDGEIKK